MKISGILVEMGGTGESISIGEPFVRLSIKVSGPDARALGPALFGRVTVAPDPSCRRCTECPDASHHWMAQSLEDADGEIVEPEQVVWACKHCDFHMPWDDPDEPEEQYTRSRRYPLWCVDTGDRWSQQRYRGPFTLARAEVSLYELNHVPDPEKHPDAKIRRCRRILPSDLASVKRRGGFLTEDMDEDAAEDAPPHQSAWADWEESLLRPKLRASGEADAGFLRWADEFLETNMFLCEGDEDPSDGVP